VDSSFVLKVSSFLGPVSRHGDPVSDHLHLHEEERVFGSHVPAFHHVRPPHLHFEVKHLHPHHEFSLLFGHLLLLLFLVLMPLSRLGECVLLLVVLQIVFLIFVLFGLSTQWSLKVLKDMLELQNMFSWS